MSIVWTLIASFLYAEIVIVLLFVLPLASAQRWQRFFRSRFLQTIGRQAQMYFYLLLGVLFLFLLDAIREMRKYSASGEHGAAVADRHEHVGMQHSMRMFRAQRNFYISGFAIFLVLVIRRLVVLISSQAAMAAESEAIKRQAQSATSAARTLLSQQKQQETATAEGTTMAGGRGDQTEGELRAHAMIDELRQKIDTLNAELVRERKDKEAMRSQSEGLHREYDALTEAFSQLERRVNVSTGGKND